MTLRVRPQFTTEDDSIGFSLWALGHNGHSLNQSSFVWLCLLFELSLVRVFSCTVLFVSISQVIGCEDRLFIDPEMCVGWAFDCTPTQTSHGVVNEVRPSLSTQLDRALLI